MAEPVGSKRQHDALGGDTGTDAPSKKARVQESKTLFVRSLPSSATTESLTEFISQYYPVRHATVVLDPKTKTSRGYGFVTFADADDATDALSKLAGEKFQDRRIKLEKAEPRHRAPGHGRDSSDVAEAATRREDRKAALANARAPPKLIVRNLPWSIKTPQQLSDLFRSYGKVKFADLPSAKGKMSGFGFVTIRGRKNAEAAIEGVNGKVVDGRTLAVDWAVDKGTWEKQRNTILAEPETSGAEVKGADARKKSKVSEQTTDAAMEDDEKQEEDEGDADIRNFFRDHLENLEDEEDDDDNDDDDDDDEAEGAPLSDDAGLSANGLEDEENTSASSKKHLSDDNSKTIFIRNLPYSVNDAELKAHFEQFGAVRYARIVIDKATDRPAGTGFVALFDEGVFHDILKNCPKARPATQQGASSTKKSILEDGTADPSGKYTIDGRVLQLSHAVDKDEATRLTETNIQKAAQRDKRRLFLLNEGVVNKNSPLHRLLAPSEIRLRDASAAQRRKLIQANPSLHISLTRLALRNIPFGMTSKELKALAREAVVGFATEVKEGRREPLSREEVARGGQEDRDAEHRRKLKGKGVVKQAKIVFETKQGSKVDESTGAGRSRGYGFVEYSSHRWALMGLRWLNGHAVKTKGEGGPKSQRLIVEFAIENAQVVARRREAQERSRAAPAGEPGQGKRRLKARRDVMPRGQVRGQKNAPSAPVENGAQAPDGDSTRMGSKAGSGRVKGGLVGKDLQGALIARKMNMRRKKAQARSGR